MGVCQCGCGKKTMTGKTFVHGHNNKKEKNNRPSLDIILMKVAFLFADRATCDRAHNGAVLVRDRRIISTGYNGSPQGTPHCIDAGCDIDPLTGSCLRTLHAETNCILFAAKNGIKTDGATLYITMMPCINCAKTIVSAGIVEVVYANPYRMTSGIEYLEKSGIKVRHFGIIL